MFADTGPKPTMEFQFKFDPNVEESTIVSGILFECDESDCSDAQPLEELGPQRLRCDAFSCNALAYGFSTYHRLENQFSDGTIRQSNIFETASFESIYTVTVRPDDLLVEVQFTPSNFPFVTIIVITCICILVSGGLLAGLIIFMVRRARKN
jgi:hypothetical protein